MFTIQNNIFLENTDSKNQIILFLFCQPIDPTFFAVLPADQKNTLVLPNVLFLELILCAVLLS